MGWIPGDGGSLTVEEEDGSPSVSGVTKIQVSNATLVDDGGGTVSMSMTPAGGANVALSNLASVAINTPLLPGTDNNIAIGSITKRITAVYVSTNFSVQKSINETNPTALLGDAVLKFGPGANSALDVGLKRPAAGYLAVTDGDTGYGALSLDTNASIYADTVTLSDAAKTAVVDIAIADGEFIGGTLTYTITATDATDHQALTGIVGFSGVRKNGTPDTYHLTIAESASPVLAESNGASTLTDTWAIDAGTNVATISVTADSSLTTPTMTCRYHLILNSANAVTKK